QHRQRPHLPLRWSRTRRPRPPDPARGARDRPRDGPARAGRRPGRARRPRAGPGRHRRADRRRRHLATVGHRPGHRGPRRPLDHDVPARPGAASGGHRARPDLHLPVLRETCRAIGPRPHRALRPRPRPGNAATRHARADAGREPPRAVPSAPPAQDRRGLDRRARPPHRRDDLDAADRTHPHASAHRARPARRPRSGRPAHEPPPDPADPGVTVASAVSDRDCGRDMAEPRPFTVHVPDDVLTDLRGRLARSRIPEDSPRRPPSGMTAGYLRELVGTWIDWDWRAREAWLNRHPQYVVPVDGTDLHYVHAPALLVMHGWPHTFALQLDFADLLPDMHVVVASLPGFGFSTPYPDGPMTEKRLASTVHALMS